jgi:acetyl esterase/lipase
MSLLKMPALLIGLAAFVFAGQAHSQPTPSEPPPDVAAQIRALGPVVNVPAVNKLYEPLLAQQPTAGVIRTNDLPYGADERHKLDTYKPEQASADKRPAVLFFHGGGFIRGDKRERSNIGYFLARNGAVAILSGDVTLTANTALYSSSKKFATREINDLGCAEADLDGQPNGYTQLM